MILLDSVDVSTAPENQGESAHDEETREILSQVLGRELPNVRPGMEVSWFSISPSDRKDTYLEGFNGIKVSHVRLNSAELKHLGLNQDQKVSATYYCLFPDSASEKELNAWKSLFVDQSQEPEEAKKGSGFF